jgi:hypothetical protein
MKWVVIFFLLLFFSRCLLGLPVVRFSTVRDTSSGTKCPALHESVPSSHPTISASRKDGECRACRCRFCRWMGEYLTGFYEPIVGWIFRPTLWRIFVLLGSTRCVSLSLSLSLSLLLTLTHSLSLTTTTTTSFSLVFLAQPAVSPR